MGVVSTIYILCDLRYEPGTAVVLYNNILEYTIMNTAVYNSSIVVPRTSYSSTSNIILAVLNVAHRTYLLDVAAIDKISRFMVSLSSGLSSARTTGTAGDPAASPTSLGKSPPSKLIPNPPHLRRCCSCPCMLLFLLLSLPQLLLLLLHQKLPVPTTPTDGAKLLWGGETA